MRTHFRNCELWLCAARPCGFSLHRCSDHQQLNYVDENKYEWGWERNTINSCWGAAPQIEHRIAGCGKTTKSSSFWQFFEQFSPKTSNLYIKNTYFANKIGSDTISWAEEGLKHFGQSQGGLPPPTQLTNTKNTMSNTSRLSRAIYYLSSGVQWDTFSVLKTLMGEAPKKSQFFV